MTTQKSGGEVEAFEIPLKAWAMARCAELQPGERVLDPMCGKAMVGKLPPFHSPKRVDHFYTGIPMGQLGKPSILGVAPI